MYQQGKKVKVSAMIPVELYDILNKERGNFTMSAFVGDLLWSYAEVVTEEQNQENNIISEEVTA